MSNILAIDSSHSHCSVALNCSGRISSRYSKEDRQHARSMLPMISALLMEQDLRLNNLDAIAIVRGPGSFTGLRIGAGVAQGLALGAGIPVLGISSLAVIAMKAYRKTSSSNLLVCLSAREQEIYSAVYIANGDDVTLQGSEQVGPADLKRFTQLDTDINWCGVGDGWKEERLSNSDGVLNVTVRIHDDCQSDALVLSELAQTRFRQGLACAAQHALPVYLKEQMDYRE